MIRKLTPRRDSKSKIENNSKVNDLFSVEQNVNNLPKPPKTSDKNQPINALDSSLDRSNGLDILD